MKAFTLFLLLLPLLVQSCFANTQDVKRPKSYHERLDLSDVYGPVDLAVYVGQRVDWNIVGYVALSVTLGLIIYTLWRYSEAPPTKPESVADVGIAEPSVIESPVADVGIAEPSVIESPVADVGIAEPSVIEVPVADVGIAEPSVIEVPVADVGIAEPSVIEVPVADVGIAEPSVIEIPPQQLATMVVDQILPPEALSEHLLKIQEGISTNMLTGESYVPIPGFSTEATMNLILETRNSTVVVMGQINDGCATQISVDEIVYLETIASTIESRLFSYTSLLQAMKDSVYEQIDACSGSLEPLEQCLVDSQNLKQELAIFREAYDAAKGMSLLSTEAPMEPALAAILEPVQGILLTVLVSLGVLRCTGSRRLSAPRVTLSLGGLGLSLATSTLLLYLGQTLLLSLVAAVLVRLVVVLVLRRRWAWFRQS